MTPAEIAKVDHILFRSDVILDDLEHWAGVLSRLLGREVLQEEVWDWVMGADNEDAGYGHGV